MVFVCIATFDPILNVPLSKVFVSSTLTEKLFPLFSIVILPSLMIAFSLYVTQTQVVRLNEGYGFFERFSFMRNYQVRKAKMLMSKINNLKKQIGKLESKGNGDEATEKKIETLKDKYYVVAGEYDRSFPDSTESIMPTKLGNILKAVEQYSGNRYGMDSTIWWPRLFNLLPMETKGKLEDTVNELYILLNFSYLSLVFYVLCVVAILFSLTISTPSTFSENLESLIRYLFAGMTALFVSAFFNRLAVYSASAYGEQLRSAYDLHRFLLLDQMRIKTPKNSMEEFDLWLNLGELIVLGPLSLDFECQSYDWQSMKNMPRDSAEQTNIKKAAPSRRNK